MSRVKALIDQAVDRLGDDLERLSRTIHDDPEPAYQEVRVTPLAREGTLKAAKVMARTTYDLLVDPALLAKAKQDFAKGGTS